MGCIVHGVSAHSLPILETSFLDKAIWVWYTTLSIPVLHNKYFLVHYISEWD